MLEGGGMLLSVAAEDEPRVAEIISLLDDARVVEAPWGVAVVGEARGEPPVRGLECGSSYVAASVPRGHGRWLVVVVAGYDCGRRPGGVHR